MDNNNAYSSVVSKTITVSGGDTGTGTLIIRARRYAGTGAARIWPRIDNVDGAAITLTDVFTDYTISNLSGSKNVKIYFEDANGTDAEIDYIIVNGTTYQAEDQVSNTSVWQNDQCGGSYSQLMFCGGYIDFGTINLGTATTTYTLNVSATNGSVSKSPNQASYNSGASVTLTATANSGYTFSGWSDDASGTTNPLTVTMNADKNITANFTTTQTGNGTLVIRARRATGTGAARIFPRLDNVDGAAITLTDAFTDYTISNLTGSKNVKVYFEDQNNTDAEIDYIVANGATYQAENQETNTSVWQNDQCGGSYAQMMHCGGYVDFGTINFGSTDVNLALNKSVTANAQISGEEAVKAVDGSVTDNSKWCNNVSGDKWLRVDLGSSQTISRWVVKHAATGGETADYNTKNFKLQKSSDGTTWTDVDVVTNNTASITDRNVASFSSRYLRLYITTPTQTSDIAARIYEFELYNAAISASLKSTACPSENDLDQIFRVYPNPASSILNIEVVGTTNEPLSISIHDLTGKARIIENVSLTQGVNNIQLDISGLKTGNYILRTIDKTNSYIRKISVLK